MDGDGLNDLVDEQKASTDTKIEKATFAEVKSDTTIQNNFFALTSVQLPKPRAFLRNSDGFNQIKISAFARTQNRGGFNSGNDFGNNSDITGGLAQGSACAGGMCH